MDIKNYFVLEIKVAVRKMNQNNYWPMQEVQ